MNWLAGKNLLRDRMTMLIISRVLEVNIDILRPTMWGSYQIYSLMSVLYVLHCLRVGDCEYAV
jgi:hypothetical protein